jgi:hypothetical protein
MGAMNLTVAPAAAPVAVPHGFLKASLALAAVTAPHRTADVRVMAAAPAFHAVHAAMSIRLLRFLPSRSRSAGCSSHCCLL